MSTELAETIQHGEQSHLTKKQRRQHKKQREQEAREKEQRKRTMKKAMNSMLVVLIAGGAILGPGWYIAKQPKTPSNEIVSRSGIHWHPELSIYIKGVKQTVSANIGIGIGIAHQPVHTHDTTGVVHLEIQGLVRKKDIQLGRFFKIWGKQFDSNCIFDSCNGPDGKIKMLVNGRENNEFENYLMQDKDKIEIRYE